MVWIEDQASHNVGSLKPKPNPEQSPDFLSFSEDVLEIARERELKVEPRDVTELLLSRDRT